MRETAYALLLSAALLASCGGGPEERDEPAKPAATAEQSWSKAQDKEATADQAQSFARVQWLTEAALEYQWIVDNHPRSRQAGDARDKVTRIRGRIDEMKSWQAKADGFMAESKKRMSDPRYLDKARADAADLSASPFPFVKKSAGERLAQVEKAVDKLVGETWAAYEKKVTEHIAAKRWGPAFKLVSKFDPAWFKSLPDCDVKVEKMRASVTSAAEADAAQVMENAAKRQESDGLMAGLAVLASARRRFAGLPMAETIRAAEAQLRAATLQKIAEDRMIKSEAAPPPEPEPVIEPEPEPQPEPQPAADEPPTDVGSALRGLFGEYFEEVPVKPAAAGEKVEVPPASKLFRNARNPLASADQWYFKAVALEKRALPGSPNYQANLKAAIEAYQKVLELYEHLLDKKMAGEDEIDERIEKIQGAMFWCKKSLSVSGE